MSELQESDEQHEATELSFTIETRESEGEELVLREYTFSWGGEFDEWHFVEYEEKRAANTARVSERNWRKSRHVWWHEQDEIDVDVPQLVTEELASRLGAESVELVV